MDINISKANDLPIQFNIALNNWKKQFKNAMKTEKIEWVSKLIYSTFEYNGKYYKINIYDICDEDTLNKCPINYLESVLETIQNIISDDLRKLGATNIRNFGFLD